MKKAIALALAATMVIATACSDDQERGNKAAGADSKVEANKTIAAGLEPNGRFMAAAKAAGLAETLAGPGPYTVFVPADQAFAAAPAGSFDAKPENRARITATLTNLILPGTVLAADIDKAIDQGKGKALLATMGGGTLTATKQDGRILLVDAAGNRATVSQAYQQFTNGVVHQVDALLSPAAARK